MAEDADARAYWRQPTWRRIAAIIAGPAANLVAAFVILTIFYALGVPNYEPTTSVQQVQVNSPAQRMGLLPGDVVVGVQGRARQGRRRRCARRSRARRRSRCACAAAAACARSGPRRRARSDDQRLLGFVFDVQRNGTLHFGPLRSAHLAEQELWLVTKGTGEALRNLVVRGDRSNVQGVVGIVREQSTAVGQGLYLEQLAWLSLSLALFNLLPFLPLDGGHILFALIERLRRKPLSREIYERVSLVGISVFVLLFLFVLQQDVGPHPGQRAPGPVATPTYPDAWWQASVRSWSGASRSGAVPRSASSR